MFSFASIHKMLHEGFNDKIFTSYTKKKKKYFDFIAKLTRVVYTSMCSENFIIFCSDFMKIYEISYRKFALDYISFINFY